MSTEGVWERQPRVLETEMGDDISLYDPLEERVTVLNRTASDIWRLLDGKTSISRIAELLSKAYQVDKEAIRGDVQATVQQLAEEDLVTREA